MQPGELFTQEIKNLLTSALLAIFGGFAKMFIIQQRLTFYPFLSCCIVSGFAGVMASYLVQYGNLPHFLQNFIIGMSGFAGPTALKLFATIYEEKLGVKRRAEGASETQSPQDEGAKNDG